MARPITDREPDAPPAPEPDPRPKEPITNVTGPVGDRWRALGGMSWGKPQSKAVALPDGRGQRASFRRTSGVVTTIIWSPQTGARTTSGHINACWGAHGGYAGFLGYPTSDILVAHDGVGSYQTFEGGLVVYHPDAGAHEVHGDILTRYGQLGGSAFGYPSTDGTLSASTTLRPAAPVVTASAGRSGHDATRSPSVVRCCSVRATACSARSPAPPLRPRRGRRGPGASRCVTACCASRCRP